MPIRVKYMRVCRDLTGYRNCQTALLDKLGDTNSGIWYAHQAIEHGWVAQ